MSDDDDDHDEPGIADQLRADAHPNAPGSDPGAPPGEPPARARRLDRGAGLVELPEIVLSTDVRATVDAAEDALARVGCVYTNARRLVHIARDPGPPNEADDRLVRREAGTPFVASLKLYALVEEITSAATWLKVKTSKKEGDQRVPAMAPPWVAKTLMERDGWPKLPALDGISDSPVFRRDGSIHAEPGYDPATRVYFDPCGVEFPRVLDGPTQADANDALADLVEPFCDWPFTGETSRMAVAAYILTIVARNAIDGPTPAFPINAREGGTGKTLLAICAGIIATGRSPAMTTYLPADKDDELRKRFMSLGLQAAAAVNIDNIAGPLGSPVLDMAITAGEITERLLTTHDAPRVPVRFVLSMTGNQIEYHADTARRVVPINLDAKCEHPSERAGPSAGATWRYADVEAYVRADRPRLLVAALTILRAFVLAGRPQHRQKPMGFPAWEAIVRSAIIFAGGADPCAGLASVRDTGADGEAEQRRALITAWHVFLGGREITLAEVVKLVGDSTSDDSRALRDALLSYCRRGEMNMRSLGKTLSKLAGRVIGELTIERAGTDRNGVAIWAVKRCGL